ncbi:MAG: hypothetical protein FWC01_00510 [Treponema sp.]|nr:hypothetical protein [Treponema sp.]MCL2236648.1 hypothetical protein [Treponema sp.]
MKKIGLTTTVFILLAFGFSSCEVGLGPKLNMDPPLVEIISPVFMANISGNLEITGTASDLQEIVHLFVTVEKVRSKDPVTGEFIGEAWEQEWHGERGVWQRSTQSVGWVLADGLWDIEENVPGFVEWAISIDMSGEPEGEYLITAGAQNNVQNRGAMEQRRVIIDKTGPVTKVTLPNLEQQNKATEEYDYFQDVLSVFNGYTLRNPSILNRLFNQDIEIQYEVNDNFSINTLAFQLVDHDGNVYYNKDFLNNVPNASWGGNYVIDEDNIDLTGGKDSDFPTAPYFLMVKSTATDKAGNYKVATHGWFVYWPESDRPWVTGVGHESVPRQAEVYPESEMQLLAYDDDGVKSVTYQIYKWVNGARGDPFIVDGNGNDFPQTRMNIPVTPGSTPSTFFSFAITAPAECSEYVIVLDCVDINDLPGLTEYRYFFVRDTSMPGIEIAGPNSNQSLFGNQSGDFTVSGTVSDGQEPVELLLVWIKPGNNMDQFEYLGAESGIWDNSGSRPTPGNNVTTTNGNILWNITLPSNAEPGEGGRYYKDFTQSINLFTDLGMGQIVSPGTVITPLVTQTFILRLEGKTEGKAVTRLHSVRGDISPPDMLTITNLSIRRGGSNLITYTLSQMQGENFQMVTLEENDTIRITGTWSDDSIRVWNSNLDNRVKEFKVTWNGLQMTTTRTWNSGSGSGTWSSDILLDEGEAVKGGGRVEASFTDLGNNITTVSLLARADTVVPRLMYISSTTSDGSYRAGSEIDVHFEFNKQVRYTGSGISLSLSGGGNAAYTSPGNNLSTRHSFTYTVLAGQNTDDLTVTAVNGFVASQWLDTNGMSPAIAVPPVAQNLGGLKDIKIDTIAPTLTEVDAITDTGFYRFGQTIYLTAKFSEDINFIPPTPNNVTMSLNLSPGTGSGRTPMLFGTDTLLFTYEIQDGDNTPASNYLLATGLNNIAGRITDIAGNPFVYSSIPSNITNNIVIDTARPVAPTISASITNGGSSPNPQEFEITNTETGATVEYSINNGPWLGYTVPVTISSTATYSIRARQTDRAGNESDPSSPYDITIQPQQVLLQGLGGSNPGTYTLNNIIEIRLNLRTNLGTLSVTGNPTLGLNITNFAGATLNRTATLINVDQSSKSLVFTYTIQETDTVDLLEITSLNLAGAQIMENSSSLNTELMSNWNLPSRMPLSFYTRIGIKTDVPSVTNVTLTNSALTITFSKDIFKGSGNITLEQNGTGSNEYRAPAVMTKSDYQRWGGNAVLGAYYTVGTNGTDAQGVPDLSEKYILNWNVEPNNNALVTALKGRNAHMVQIPVLSGAVTVSANRRIMTVDLTEAWGYNLRVRGVAYQLSLDNTIVRDEQNNSLAAYTPASLTNPGVNAPFIRVQKNRGTFSNANVSTGGGNTVDVTRYYRLTGNTAITVRIGANAPTETGTWVRTSRFHIRVPETATNIIYLTGGNNRISFFDIRNNGGGTMGHVFNNNNALSFAWSGNNNNRIYNNDNAQTTENGGNVFVNPVEHVIYNGERWNQGDIVFSNVWINIAGLTAADNATANQTGWFPVTTSETTGGTQVSTAVTTQPRTAQVRIDSQTPSANIRYSTNQTTQNPQQGTSANPFTGGSLTAHPAAPSFSPTFVSNTTDHVNGITFDVGNATADNFQGIIVGIRATARTNAQNISGEVFEKASRSVIQFNYSPDIPNNWGTLSGLVGTGRALQLWLRGGTDVTGQNSFEGFPLSWDENDSAGIRLMTDVNRGTALSPLWYWMSWEITDTAYFYFIAGSTSTATTATSGPHRWAWGKNAWAVQQAQYPLHPGGSLLFTRNTIVARPATERFEFYDAFSGGTP